MRPEHYPGDPWDFIAHNNLSFDIGNALKYIIRHKLKGDPMGDLKKAISYLNHENKFVRDYMITEISKPFTSSAATNWDTFLDRYTLSDSLEDALNYIKLYCMSRNPVYLDLAVGSITLELRKFQDSGKEYSKPSDFSD